MTIDKFLDITQPIINKDNSLFLVTLMCEYIAVYACYASLGNIILKCNHGIKSLSTRDVSKVIFKHIDDCTDIYIDYKSTLYDISRIMKQDFNVKTPIVALTATNITETVIEENKDYIY